MGCNQSKINKAVQQDAHPILNNQKQNSSLPNNTSILQEEEEQQLLGKNSHRSSSINYNVDSNSSEVAAVSIRRNTIPSIDDKRNNSDIDTKKQQRHSYASSGASTNNNNVSKTSDGSYTSVGAVQYSPKVSGSHTLNSNDTVVKGNKEIKGKKKTAWSGKHKLRSTDTPSSSVTSKQQKDESSTHSTPPPPPPTLSTTEATSDPNWIQIYQKLSSQIIDPEDLPIILSSIISSQIDLLMPVEVTFIKKRVKYSLSFVINNEGSVEGDQGGVNGNSGGSNGEGGNRERRKSTLSIVSKKLGLNSSSNLPSSKSNQSYTSDSSYPALDESSERTKTTKQIYKHEHTIDITTLRKIFENGDNCIRQLKRNVKAELILFGSSMEGVSNSSPTDNDNQTTTIRPAITTQQANVEQISQIDIYGSTFLLLLHLSDVRFEYITELAKVSSEDANLILDVNKLCLLNDETKKNDKVGREDTKIPPPPPSLNPNIAPPSNTQSGISFTSLCYLISLSKFGTKLQRLQLLFYTLLPPKALNKVLKSHPAGNIPTWLLECDTNLILSYDSLSYYYVYDIHYV